MNAKKEKMGDREVRKRDGLEEEEKKLQPYKDVTGWYHCSETAAGFSEDVQHYIEHPWLSQKSKG